MPALNIIAIQDTVRNSGSSSSRPSGIAPNLLTANHSTKITNADDVTTKSQPVFSMVQVSAEPDTLLRDGVLTKPHTRKPTAIAAVTPNTTQSMPRLRACSSSSTGTSSAGCGITPPDPVWSARTTRRRFRGSGGSSGRSMSGLASVVTAAAFPQQTAGEQHTTTSQGARQPGKTSRYQPRAGASVVTVRRRADSQEVPR